MTDGSPTQPDVPLAHLSPKEKAKRANVFGQVASQYERFRPGPPQSAVDWLLPSHVARVVDLGAGTGALTRLLMDKADQVVAIEPDDRMRAILVERVPGVRALSGRGESMPLPDRCADAVLASSSWHWMDPALALAEVGRVLTPTGVLGTIWSGPDPEGPFFRQAQALLAEQVGTSDGADSSDGDRASVTGLMLGDAMRPASTLEIPPGVPFEPPEHEIFTWDVALDADDLIGLLGTLSWVINLPGGERERLVTEARRLLSQLLGIEGEVTVDVTFRADVWRSRPTG